MLYEGKTGMLQLGLHRLSQNLRLFEHDHYAFYLLFGPYSLQRPLLGPRQWAF